MEDFATYILEEENYVQKMVIVYYLSKKTGIYFDKSVVLKTQLAKMFMDYIDTDMDKNLVATAMLLCNCKKIDNALKVGKLETFAKEGAEYLETLGFNKRFCKICEELNTYSRTESRERESYILEVVDQFVGLILNRVEREAFSTQEALIILTERNLKHSNNKYLDSFVTFVNDMENVYIKDIVEVPVIKKLVSIHNKEANVKTFIASIGNRYSAKIDKIISKVTGDKAKKAFSINDEKNQNTVLSKNNVATVSNKNRPLFSKEIADRIMNHKSEYKIEE